MTNDWCGIVRVWKGSVLPMRLSWKLGQVAGIDLFLHPSALIVWFIAAHSTGTGLIDALPLVVALFASIVLHELGHALMARRYGIGTNDITLYMIGGIARLNRMPRSAGPELLIALAGPVVNVVISAVLAGVMALGVHHRLLYEVLGLNIMLVLFNLLPIFPMDGGRVFRALLSGWLGRVRATEIAATVGQALAIVGGVVALFNGQWEVAILAVFIYGAAAVERFQVLAEARQRDPASQGLINPPEAPAGFRWADRGDGVYRLIPNLGRGRTWGQS